jgi:hypothetical protein
MTFEETLDKFLNRKLALARGILKDTSQLTVADF